MFNLHIVQAAFGDALLLEYGDAAQPRFALIDGGPMDVYQAHLKPVARKWVTDHGQLDLAVLSHVDNDHVVGLLDLFQDLSARQQAGKPRMAIGALWHNAFVAAEGRGLDAGALQAVAEAAPEVADVADAANAMTKGFKEGDRLHAVAEDLGVPVNPDFAERLVLAEEAGPRRLGTLDVWVIGPTAQALEKLRRDWQEWVKKQQAKEIRKDQSVPNLSSIMLLVASEGKRVLLPGDGRGDEIMAGLKASGAWQSGDVFHVDVLKLPHHGSARNVSPEFFRQVTADRYVICADGTNGNPDPATLTWLIDAAQEGGRKIEIIATSKTPSLEALVAERPPRKNGYTLRVMPVRAHEMALTLE
jgi:hypothetical protein